MPVAVIQVMIDGTESKAWGSGRKTNPNRGMGRSGVRGDATCMDSEGGEVKNRKFLTDEGSGTKSSLVTTEVPV